MAKIKSSPRITFRLPTALRAKLEKLADLDGRDLSNYLRKVVSDHAQEKSKPATVRP